MNFKVGDRVRIKSWEQMEKEFGRSCGKIPCMCIFSKEMSHLCGRTATISKINGSIVDLTNWSDNNNTMSWIISTDMIELVDTSKFTKSDLQEGDIVTDREGCRSLYYDGNFWGATLDVCDLTDDLKDKNDYSDNDIVKVERPIKMEIVFERKEESKIREMTVEEISKELGYEVKVVK